MKILLFFVLIAIGLIYCGGQTEECASVVTTTVAASTTLSSKSQGVMYATLNPTNPVVVPNPTANLVVTPPTGCIPGNICMYDCKDLHPGTYNSNDRFHIRNIGSTDRTGLCGTTSQTPSCRCLSNPPYWIEKYGYSAYRSQRNAAINLCKSLVQTPVVYGSYKWNKVLEVNHSESYKYILHYLKTNKAKFRLKQWLKKNTNKKWKHFRNDFYKLVNGKFVFQRSE